MSSDNFNIEQFNNNFNSLNEENTMKNELNDFLSKLN